MGQGVSNHHHNTQGQSHHHHQQPPPQWAMEPSEPTHSPHQVRQRVQHQQQQRELREQLERESQESLLHHHQYQPEAVAADVGCCGSESASSSSCSCGGGLASTAAIYGTASSPDHAAAHHPVVVTPPRSLPHHHHHHHHHHPPPPPPPPASHHHHHHHQLQQAEATTLPTPGGATSGPSCSTAGACNSSSSSNGCGHWCSSCRVRVQVEVECVNGLDSRPSPPRGGRLRTLAFPKRHRHKTKTPTRDLPAQPKKKKTPWFRLNCRLRPSRSEPEPESSASVGCGGCMCPSLRRPEPELHTHHHHHHMPHHHHLHHRHSSGQESPSISSVGSGSASASSPGGAVALKAPVIDLSRFNPDAYPIEDWEEQARQERAREMVEGVEPPPGFGSTPSLTPAHHAALSHLQLQNQHQLQLQQAGAVTSLPITYNSVVDLQLLLERSLRLGLGGSRPLAASFTEDTLLLGRFSGDGSLLQRTVHTQVDYIHCLVPDLLSITNCAFYWGKMDRYEAERLLDNRPEGTFLLRDSAQEEYLFSVSFRRYGRSLHARIEQWKHKFSFDSHDPGVFASDTVCGLIEHYKDPSCCMFFEPMLTIPLVRTCPFPLQHLCRAVICSTTTYDGINSLLLPKSLNNYLKEYHYKQRVRVRRLDH